jgi:hypothetical protein
MVPDFSGTLEENEVYLHLSQELNDKDKMSPQSCMPLTVDLLVARSPMHFCSDVQRVTAVDRKELHGLKDVIVFSTKGNSLAAKLSGGDFDGDKAWTCWEPSLVEQFVNAEVPAKPNLLNAKYLTKISTTYESLVQNVENPVSEFLHESFEFNMKRNLLGTCTKFKEKYCYNDSVETEPAILLSTLLSDLVDQAKSGIVFTDADWKKLLKEKILDSQIRIREPKYWTKEIDSKSCNIIDQLTYVTHETVEKTLEYLHEHKPVGLGKRDNDIAKYYDSAKANATDPDWAKLLSKLCQDILEVKELWGSYFRAANGDDKHKTGPAIEECFPKYKAIQPHPEVSEVLKWVLLKPGVQASDLSDWELLKASALYCNYNLGSLPWRIAGKQLCYMKARQDINATLMSGPMYAMTRPDKMFAKAWQNKEQTGNLEDSDEGDLGVDGVEGTEGALDDGNGIILN